MCGPSSQENQLAAQSQSFSNLLQANYGTLFGDQLGVLNSINKSLSPILAAGPNQQGFSAAELAATNTQAVNAAGGANKAAQQAAANFGAGEGGGGSSGLTSGIQKQIQASIASTSANQLANTQNQITQANYAQGNANYWRAAGGLQTLAGEYSPNAAMQGTIGENQAAFGEADQINQQNQQLGQTIAGGISSLGRLALTGVAGGINAAPGQSFASGFFGALGG